MTDGRSGRPRPGQDTPKPTNEPPGGPSRPSEEDFDRLPLTGPPANEAARDDDR